MGKMLGIDVSDNQGVIDWKKVKAAGVEFAFLRSTRGSGQPDKQVASNVKGCMEHKIPFGFYKYQYALTPEQSREEAEAVVALLKKLGVKPSKDVFVFADVEYKPLISLGMSRVTDIINAFKTIIDSSGYAFGLYAGMYDYYNLMESSRFNVPVWIARYYSGYNVMEFGAAPNEKYCPKPKGGSELCGWQYTSSGRVPGIQGNVDMNICYMDIRFPEIEPEYYETPEFTLIDSLNKIGVDSSFNHRAKIAQANSIHNYIGSLEQNLMMLQLLKEGKLIMA